MIQTADVAHRFWLGRLNVPGAIATRKVVSRGPAAKALKLLPAITLAHPLYIEVLRELGEEALLADGAVAASRGKRGLEERLSRAVSELGRAVRLRLRWLRPAGAERLHANPVPTSERRPSPPRPRPHVLPSAAPELHREMLARMALIRAFERRLSVSWAAGDVPTEAIHLSIGQEAVAVGACFALRSDDLIVPLDLETVVRSVDKTGRLVTVEEGPLTHGFGAEVVARVSEVAWGALLAPPRRVAGRDVPIPSSHGLEMEALASAARVVETVRATLAHRPRWWPAFACPPSLRRPSAGARR